MGYAIHEFFHTGKDVSILNWIDGEEEEPMSASIFFRNEAASPSIEKTAMTLAAGKVLDVGAGAGRHSLILASRGLDVTSLDTSSYSCEVMKARGLKRVLNMPILDFHGEKFDTILLLMNGIGIAGSAEVIASFLDHLKSLLNDGGSILCESTDILYTMENKAASRKIDMSKRYYGEVKFKLKFRLHEVEFPWVYADENLLEEYAMKCGLKWSLLERGERFNFLCRMSI